MNLKKTLKVIKNGENDELEEAKRALKDGFADKSKKTKAFQEIIENIPEYEKIDNEKNKLAFIYGVKLAAKERGVDYFPLFTEFIIENIQSDSGNVRREIIRLTNVLVSSMIVEGSDLTKPQKKLFSEFIDDILLLLETYYDPEYDKYESVSDMPACKYKSLEMLIEKLINPSTKKGKIDKKSGMPKWVDCTWKRVPCMNDKCPICSRLKEMEEVANLFERGELFIELAGEVQADRDNLPEPDEFPFYEEVGGWIDSILELTEKSKMSGDFWIFTEEAADLFWYVNVLSTKTYRQLCNRYLIDNDKEESFVDYRYTNYVLEESIKKIKKSLKGILKSTPEQSKEIKEAFNTLSQMEERLLNI